MIERIYQDFIVRGAGIKLWICDDGYLHQLTIDELLAVKEQPELLKGLSMKVRISDVDGTISIAAPSEVRQLEPTAEASPVASPGTTAAGIPMTASRRATIYAEPHALSRTIGQVAVGETVQLLERTDNGTWYRIIVDSEQTGWVRVAELPIPGDIAEQVPVAATSEPTIEAP
jgi:hypothetical protein